MAGYLQPIIAYVHTVEPLEPSSSWNKGGSVAWQLCDGKLLSPAGRADGLPAWSLPTAFTDQSGNFTIVY